jgi:hypothetical protein
MPVSRIHRTASPFNAAELAEIDYEQAADVIYFAHENHPPAKLIRASHVSWSYETIAFGPTTAIPTGIASAGTVGNSVVTGDTYFPQPASYAVTAYDETTAQESRASAAVTETNDLGLKKNYNTISWSAVAGATAYRIYKSQNTGAFGYIGTTTQLSFRDNNIGPDTSEGPPVGDNPFAEAGDYPGCVTFHEQRSYWGRSINRPNALWASRSADFENMDFTRPARADDAFAIGLVANKVNAIAQLVSTAQGLLALTSHNIFVIQGSNEDYIAASPPPRVRPAISRGASRLNPITIDNAIFYETAKGGEIRTIGYQFELDGIKTDDLTIFSRHLFERQDIIDWAYAEKPASCIWLVRADGKLLCLTWDQAQEVWGWTLCETDGAYEGVCVLYENGEDRVYFTVRRTIGGGARLYVERMASELWEAQEDCCYLDCARTFVNAEPVSLIDRLDHLEGKTVAALVDGNVVRDLVVANGRVALPAAGNRITIGLPFEALIETLPLAIQTGSGWSVARPQQAGKAIIRMVETRGILAGPDEDQLFEVKDREDEAYGAPARLTTGDREIDLAGTSQDEAVVIVKSADPLPMQIAAILIEPDIRGD